MSRSKIARVKPSAPTRTGPVLQSSFRPFGLLPCLALISAATPAVAQPVQPRADAVPPLNTGGSTRQLERSWNQLNRQMEDLDSMLGPAPALQSSDDLEAPKLPANLLDANAPASGPLTPSDALPDPPLGLPKGEAKSNPIKAVSLKEAIAIAFRNNPNLQLQRDQIAAQAAIVAAAAGSYWPTISVFANVEGFQSGTTTYSPYANNSYGFGPSFNAQGQFPNVALTENGSTVSGDSPGPFYVPAGGGLGAVANGVSADAGLQLEYAVIDFARTPRVRAAQAVLEQQEKAYANDLRALQLAVSEAYYDLQRTEQLVRIRDAVVRTDLVVLEDVLDLKRAGLVPRVDLLRRSAVLSADQEDLIQAMADRAVARRRLWSVLNLPASVTPSAADPISLQPAWPMNLEQTLLAAYDNNPELEAILATRRALALRQDATAAQLLPKLSLFAAAGGLGSVERLFNFTVIGGGCCGATFLPLEQVSGYEWSVGLAFNWLIFDAGTTSNSMRALALREQAEAQRYANTRNTIRLRLEQAFLNHEASLAKLVSARRGVGASKEAFRDTKLRYQTGLANEVDLSVTQERLVNALVRRLFATVDVNTTYARLLRELLPMPSDPTLAVPTQLTLDTSQRP
ncbi:TolC family protein [Synechococcus sp. BS56D]|uniref:TolC family protein n=1 Tax=Synechococcus sp. BS56D TaxID=2055944 RepID=UPI00103A98E6|nr:TolC family protein [Synechococcus sp. BS56D]TCD55339.1 TolC family protein [Synechococcus sp. BS56D]